MNTLMAFKNQFSLWIGRASARPGGIGGYTAPMVA
jgi:hypothetical protein